MAEQKAYYSVFGLKDGIVWLATQQRKPVRSRTWGRPQIDEDGIYSWFVDKVGDGENMTDQAKVAKGTTIATCLNMKRVVREQVEPRLAALAQQVSALRVQLNRIEQKLGEKE
ncbi:MAG TPA: hypothetical protein PKY77_10830 [Phycisphaerae bacterium]|nr:hypothetical protein [Phycisphaerae bacterium]HRY70074.1 hypothetical protein [Phycisphaerae bacterium]HSA27350.1 hypothetical protein [Phycisphaerae bacterium]